MALLTHYEDDLLAVRADLDRAGPAVTISFTHASRDPAMVDSEFGRRLFDGAGLPVVYFVNHKKHWWQVEAMERAFEAVDRLRLASRFDEVVCYGSSMGGHGALLFSSRLGASRALAFCPQYAFLGRGRPWNRKWRPEPEGLVERYRPEDHCSPRVRATIVYDPLSRIDRDQVDGFASHMPVERVPAPFGGHNTLMHRLVEYGLLSSFVRDFIAGRDDPQELRRAIRDRRRTCAGYLAGLSTVKARSPCVRRAALDARRKAIDVTRYRLARDPADAFAARLMLRSALAIGPDRLLPADISALARDFSADAEVAPLVALVSIARGDEEARGFTKTALALTEIAPGATLRLLQKGGKLLDAGQARDAFARAEAAEPGHALLAQLRPAYGGASETAEV